MKLLILAIACKGTGILLHYSLLMFGSIKNLHFLLWTL